MNQRPVRKVPQEVCAGRRENVVDGGPKAAAIYPATGKIAVSPGQGAVNPCSAADAFSLPDAPAVRRSGCVRTEEAPPQRAASVKPSLWLWKDLIYPPFGG